MGDLWESGDNIFVEDKNSFKKLEEINWDGKDSFLDSKFNKVTPIPIGNPEQLKGITSEQRFKNLKRIIKENYENLGINAYSSGIVYAEGYSNKVVQFYII